MGLMRGFDIARARRDEKHRILLDFLRTEIVTTSEIAQVLLGCQRQSAWRTLKGMERDGLVFQHEFRTEIARKTIWGLTAHGAAMAHPPGEDAPYFEPGRLGENTLAHDLWLQKIRLIAEGAGWKNWTSEKLIKREVGAACIAARGAGDGKSANKTKWRRIPDAVALTPDGEMIAVEVERTIKAPKRYADIMSMYLQMISKKTISRVHYVCITPSVRDRLIAIFSKIRTVPIDGSHPLVEEKHRAKFQFFTVDEWLSDTKTKEQTA